MAVSDWSSTASANNTIDGISIGEGCAPGNLNDAIRAVMANVRVFYDNVPVPLGAAAAGANTDITSLRRSVTLSASGTATADSIGFRGLPPVSPSGSYTLLLDDQGRSILLAAGGLTIPANTSVPFPIGTVIAVYNNSGASQTIGITSDTLRLAGGASTGTRTLAIRGLVTLLKVAATEWVASGNVT